MHTEERQVDAKPHFRTIYGDDGCKDHTTDGRAVLPPSPMNDFSYKTNRINAPSWFTHSVMRPCFFSDFRDPNIFYEILNHTTRIERT